MSCLRAIIVFDQHEIRSTFSTLRQCETGSSMCRNITLTGLWQFGVCDFFFLRLYCNGLFQFLLHVRRAQLLLPIKIINDPIKYRERKKKMFIVFVCVRFLRSGSCRNAYTYAGEHTVKIHMFRLQHNICRNLESICGMCVFLAYFV